ncbi:hypothetical protein AN1V17_27420 [Vallitalea sediminicola]
MGKNKYLYILIMSVILFVILIAYYFINSSRSPHISNKVSKVKILDLRSGEDITIKDKEEVTHLIYTFNNIQYKKSNIKNYPNGPTYELTFMNNEKHYGLAIYDGDEYYLIHYTARLKNYNGMTDKSDIDILDYIDKLYESKNIK